MGWQERFKQGTFGINPQFGNASFRGVPFFVDSHKVSTGKRLAEHEYPQSRNGNVEDLGPSIRKHTITASIIGDDHMDQRDSLLAVCDKNGTGVLQHPYLGKLTVQCKLCDVTEGSEEFRVTRLTLEFWEAGTVELTKAAPNTKYAVMDKVDAAYLALHTTFLKAYAIAGVPYSEAQQVQKVVGLGLTAINDSKKIVGRVAEYFKVTTDIANTIVTIFADALALVTGITTLSAFGVTDEGKLPIDFVVDRAQELNDVKAMWNFSPLATTPTATVIPSAATDALIQAVQVSGVITAAGISSLMEFSSAEEASLTLTSVVEKIDALMDSTTPVLDDVMFVALQDLRSVVSADIDARSRTLARLVTYSVNQPLPAVVISNVLYGDVGREADLLLRNNIGHPGFAGGAPLKVLIDA